MTGEKLANFGEIVFRFPVYYSGWEGDTDGYVVKDESGEHQIVLSSHGRFFIADETELKEKIAEYEKAVDETRKALYYVKTSKVELITNGDGTFSSI